MPKLHLPPFIVFEEQDFHVGGDPLTVTDTGYDWLEFGGLCDSAAGDLQGLDTESFQGSEGDRFSELAHNVLPNQVGVTGGAHYDVGDAICAYGDALQIAHTDMGILVGNAQVHHAAVNMAVDRVNAAEQAAAAAAASAVIGGVGAGVMAATQVELEAALAHYEVVMTVWEQDLVVAKEIKQALGEAVDDAVRRVNMNEVFAFDEGSTGVGASLWDLYLGLEPLMGDMVIDGLHTAADFMSLIPLPGWKSLIEPGLNTSAALVSTVGAFKGYYSWDEVKDNYIKAGKSLNPIPGRRQWGAWQSLVKGDFDQAWDAAVSRGERVTAVGEPVDVARGSLVDSTSDVVVDGMLPIVVSRDCRSDWNLDGTFGLGWVSSIDCSLEVFDNYVVMVAPDGALVAFDAPSAEGIEVRGKGRGWLLSFVNGAYRVRNVASGVVYVFTTVGDVKDHVPEGGVDADTFGVVGDDFNGVGSFVSGYGRGASSVAAHLDSSVQVGLSLMLHRSGMWVEYVRNAVGTLECLRRSDGVVVDFAWDNQVGRLSGIWIRDEKEVQEFDIADRVVGYEYDRLGLLRRVINSQQGVLEFDYDDSYRMCGWRDRNGVVYRHIFDDAGRVVAQAGSGGMFANAFVWLNDDGEDAPTGGRVCVAVETAGEFVGDPLTAGESVIAERLKRLEHLPLVQALRSGGLRAAGLVGRGRDGIRPEAVEVDGGVSTEWLYDEVLGDLRATVYRSSASGDVWRVVSPEGVAVDYVHNDCHQLVGVVGADGGVTEYIRDEYGQVVEALYPDGSGFQVETGTWGVPVRVVSSSGLTTEYEVDGVGNVVSVTDPLGRFAQCEYQWRVSGVVPCRFVGFDGIAELVECDEAGLIVAREDASGARWSWVRDKCGRIVESMDPDGAVTTFEYSPEGWLVTAILPDGSKRQVTYDGEGNPIEVINELGQVSRVRYTVFDKPVEMVDPAGGVMQLVYNTQMEVVAIVNADGRRWEYERGLEGQVVKERDFNGLVTRIHADPVRRQLQVVDPAGGVSIAQFDGMGRPLWAENPQGDTTLYTYDKWGLVESVMNPWSQIIYDRDQWGQITAERTVCATGEQMSMQPRRDQFGRIDGVLMQVAGHITQQQFEYDPDTGRIAGLTVAHNSPQVASSQAMSPNGAVIDGLDIVGRVDFGVDHLGRRDRYEIDSVIRQWGFDGNGRIITDIVTADRGRKTGQLDVIAGRQFTWRGDNVITQIQDVLTGTSVFDVDALGRVCQVKHDPTPALAHFTNLNANTGSAGGQVVETYAYSSAGRLESITTPHMVADHVKVARSRQQVESASETLVTDKMATVGTLVTRVGKTSYQYDALGRVVCISEKRLSQKPLVKHFTYRGAGGQVASFYHSDAPHLLWEYTYDPEGRRITKTCTDTTTNTVVTKVLFGYIGHHLAVEHYLIGQDDSTVARAWFVDPETGEIIGQLTTTTSTTNQRMQYANQVSQGGSDVRFYALVADLAGAPKELINTTTGKVIGNARYTLYGKRIWKGEKCPLLFAGQYADRETGWVYNRYRYYDPTAGVYTTQDPLGIGPNPATTQGYVTNPTTYIDYLGLKQCAQAAERNADGVWNDTGKNAGELRKSMVGEGMTPSPGDEAHHIVPARLIRGSSPELRGLFHKHGVSLNSHVNGEFLPNKKPTLASGDTRLGHHGSGVHSKAEINAIYEYLKDSPDRDAFIAGMGEIKKFHGNGVSMVDVEAMASESDYEMNSITLEVYQGWLARE